MTKAFPTILTACLLFYGASVSVPAKRVPQSERTCRVVFQNGLDGYAGATDDGRDGALKLMDDRKSTDPRWPNPDYRHILRFGGLRQAFGDSPVKVLSATLSLRYFDEWWSLNVYHIGVYRSLDGSADRIAADPEDTEIVYGDRFKDAEKTPRPSWVTWKLKPETVQAWLDHPTPEDTLALRVASRDFSRGDEGNYGLKFRSCLFGTPWERPKLTVTVAYAGDLPPRAPTWDFRYGGARVGRVHALRWRAAVPADLDGDAVRYEVDVRPPAGRWRPVARGVPGCETLWHTTALPPGDGYRLRIRARDGHAKTSAWTETDGGFRLVRADVAYQIGVASSLVKIRRDVPFVGNFGATIHLETPRNGYDDAQIVVANVDRPLSGLSVQSSDLRSTRGVIPRSDVSVRQVGYVNTVASDHYSASYAGLWPDPLLELPRVDVPVGRVQPLWVTVRAPEGAPPGEYHGTLTLRAENADPITVALTMTVWDFTLPTPGRFRAMVIDGDSSKALLDRLLANRLSPAYVMRGWDWDRPHTPVAFKDGRWDFSEADRIGAYCLARGMNAFTIARFATPGKFGFPPEYSADYRARFREYLAAYATHLRARGWLKMAHVYNIDEAAPEKWPACRENYKLSKDAAPDVPVMQCLNEPKGVAALAGSVDIWDVYIGQFKAAGAPARIQAGDDAICALCCYPSTHPNLFIDYPAMDARMIGWLSWKMGVSGFEYWSANSWGDNLKRLGARPYLDEVESRWKANAFGDYNGDGYLVYPGPNGSVLSSIRLENLRDGFQDYEMLAMLKDQIAQAKASGADVSADERLLALDTVCRPDLTCVADPDSLLRLRRQIARSIVALGRTAHR